MMKKNKKGGFGLLNNVGARLKLIRSDLSIKAGKKITQQVLADSLGIKKRTLASYEADGITPGDAFVKLMCDTYHVNKEWLLNGTGEMYSPDPTAEIADMAKYMLAAQDDDLKKQFLEIIFRLNPEQIKALGDVAKQLAEAQGMVEKGKE